MQPFMKVVNDNLYCCLMSHVLHAITTYLQGRRDGVTAILHLQCGVRSVVDSRPHVGSVCCWFFNSALGG